MANAIESLSAITPPCGLGYPFAGLDWKAPTQQPAQRREE
nr:MAG TPA: hypothetical protein [Caudoviricetes sp.]